MNDIDVVIAELVMGQRRVSACPLDTPTCPGKFVPQVGHWPCLPPYSSSIEAAWHVVERIKSKGYEGELYNCLLGRVNLLHCTAEKAAENICYAALGAYAAQGIMEAVAK